MDLEAIKARHKAADSDSGWEWAGLYAYDAHADRAALIARVEELTEALTRSRDLLEMAESEWQTGHRLVGYAHVASAYKVIEAALKGDTV